MAGADEKMALEFLVIKISPDLIEQILLINAKPVQSVGLGNTVTVEQYRCGAAGCADSIGRHSDSGRD
ncbi:unnamed protein product [Nippostrongylus brasiliensis]|uniref:Propanediol dehydratase reactivation factor large subunit n=1 Tax=Nippostrongylus brasiliensis TaxID=27835 RepID=A0A0N4YLY2_NIPBR|nr:unnamed protein product [Nippostrongylus brasiliensis]